MNSEITNEVVIQMSENPKNDDVEHSRKKTLDIMGASTTDNLVNKEPSKNGYGLVSNNEICMEYI